MISQARKPLIDVLLSKNDYSCIFIIKIHRKHIKFSKKHYYYDFILFYFPSSLFLISTTVIAWLLLAKFEINLGILPFGSTIE